MTTDHMTARPASEGGRGRFYFGVLALVFLAIALVIWLPAILLWRTGETWPERWGARYLIENDAIWGSGLLQNEVAFKRALYDEIEPEVVVVGSSQVLQFRRQMFNLPFMNMGRGLSEVLDFERSFDDLTARHSPRLVIWGIDYWIFSQALQASARDHDRTTRQVSFATLEGRKAPEILSSEVFSTWNLFRRGSIREGRITWDDAIQSILHGASRPGPRLGLRAVATDYGGYVGDGSFYYFDPYQRPTSRYREAVENAELLVSQDRAVGLQPVAEIAEEAVADVAAAVRLMRARGIDVVLFVPPVSGPLARLVTRATPDRVAYFRTLDEKMEALARETGAVYFDALNEFDTVDLAASEFIDSGHPGEPASAKLLLYLASLSLEVAALMDRSAVEALVQEFGGRAVVDRPDFYARFGIARQEPWPVP